jgi:hypothetical protein
LVTFLSNQNSDDKTKRNCGAIEEVGEDEKLFTSTRTVHIYDEGCYYSCPLFHPRKNSKKKNFKFFASKLKHKVWHYLNGFNDGNKQNLRYLNAQEEEELVEEIKQHEDAQDALNLHEVIEIVFLKYSLTLQGLWDGTWKNIECIRKNGDSL